MSIVDGWDATHENVGHTPAGQGAGYTTGSPDIKWTEQDWQAHPTAVRICQDAGASDDTADELDIERGAATIAEAPSWVHRARASFQSGKRPGQRQPAIYISASNVPALRDQLVGAGISTGVFLHVAHWGVGRAFAVSELEHTGGAFPECGFQFANGEFFDTDVWSVAWLDDVSAAPSKSPAPKPPTASEGFMQQLPTVKQGDTGKAVRTAQALLVARYHHLGTTGTLKDGIDGDFGPMTDAAVKDAQGEAKIAVDGIVGPATWPILAGV